MELPGCLGADRTWICIFPDIKSNKKYKGKNTINIMKNSWFKGKKVTATLAVVVFFAGFLFVDRGSISGNVIVNNTPSFNTISLIGLLLVLCSAILAAYTIRKR